MGAAQPFTTTQLRRTIKWPVSGLQRWGLGFRRVDWCNFRAIAAERVGLVVSHPVWRIVWVGVVARGAVRRAVAGNPVPRAASAHRGERNRIRTVITDVVSVCGLRAVNSTTSRSRVGSVTPRPRTRIAGRSLSMSSRIGTTLIGWLRASARSRRDVNTMIAGVGEQQVVRQCIAGQSDRDRALRLWLVCRGHRGGFGQHQLTGGVAPLVCPLVFGVVACCRCA